FACISCGAVFRRKHDGQRHLLRHTGDLPFPCHGGCNKHFRRTDGRSRHWATYRECERRHFQFLQGAPKGH
ncbi:hypothetical protein AURDEDRAFT_68031, partial [Auricularia subglabra TFB-10046 SS5]